jgi:TIR domain
MVADSSTRAEMAESSVQHEQTAKRALYVVHAAPDAWFVRGALLPALGLAAGQVQLTSAPPLGEPFLRAFDRGIAGSRVTAVVISRAFLADEWAQHAELMAHHAALAGEHRVVPIFLDEVASPRWRALRVSLELRDPERWDEELARLAEMLATAPPPAPAELACPYPGMRSLGEDDGELLVGREREIADVVARLGAGQRRLFLIGPSGSGKSSLVSAGVIPRLVAAQPGVTVRRFRPGEHPCRRLADAVDALAEGRSSAGARSRALLVVDQLEEAFTLAGAEERARFFAELRALEEEGRTASLFCLRADFFGELMGSALWDPERPEHDGNGDDTWLVAPLRGEALRQAIERPALTAGVYLEPGLTERLLADAGADPGALPILQETMRQLWELRKRRVLSLASYRAMGEAAREVGGSGLAVAMSRCGDACLQALSPGQARIARRVLLRLVSFGHGAADTRRQQPRSALRQEGEPEAELDQVLIRLVDSRLVSIYEPVDAGGARRDDPRPSEARVDLVHEALIKAWGRLAGWIEERRAAGQRRRHLEEAASSWVARGRRGGGLLEASELSEARTWRASEDGRELGESEELRQLVAASSRARRWWWWRVATGLAGSVAVLVAGALMLGGVLEKNRAELERSEAEAEACA